MKVPETKNDRAIFETYKKHPETLTYKKVDEFSDVSVFMKYWIELRNPNWLNVEVNDVITLGEGSTVKYIVKYIDLYKDVLQLSPLSDNVIWKPRLISDIPFMQLYKARLNQEPIQYSLF